MTIVDLYDEIASTEVLAGDVFHDRFELPPGEIEAIQAEDLSELWMANPRIYRILRRARSLESARERLFDYLNDQERWVFALDNELHPLEKANVRECVRVFMSIIGPINEKRAGFSAVETLWKLARNELDRREVELSRGFVLEFIHLFRGVAGLSGIYSPSGVCRKEVPAFIAMDGREAALVRSAVLDEEGRNIEERIKRFPSGFDPAVRRLREERKKKILNDFGGAEDDWNDYRWHLKHVIRDEEMLAAVTPLTPTEKQAIHEAKELRIPFGVTPYYAHLMDNDTSRRFDYAVRMQVMPPPSYIEGVKSHRKDLNHALDFMGEHDTSPIDLITRRYPKIAILKPYNTCAQICVYCQRNWEIQDVLDENALSPKERIVEALAWLKDHPTIADVLITGGDPGVMQDDMLEWIVSEVAAMPHVRRIRIGTRTPVVLPQRVTPEWCDILGRYHELGRREVSVVTHFQHTYEVTPEACEAVQRLVRKGIAVYNQTVFTFSNSRRFELVALRRALRSIGVDPYYTFNAKGKEETRDYRVPIARLLQERKEEARLLPGLDRTDEPVFNVPRLGKNHLRSWQDHRVVMILPDGRRIYEFHPWEKNIKAIPPYTYADVAIWDYLKQLQGAGEDIREYRNIWYYY
ncbi:MAG: KamA family radical SAM protein [Acidobacteriota bacterium]